MKKSWSVVVIASFLAAACDVTRDVQQRPEARGAAATADDDDGDDGEESDEVDVALDQVPAGILAAAKAAVPGFVAKSAEKETEEGALHYCIAGTAGGETVEIEVNATDAKVVEIERGEDDED